MITATTLNSRSRRRDEAEEPARDDLGGDVGRAPEDGEDGEDDEAGDPQALEELGHAVC